MPPVYAFAETDDYPSVEVQAALAMWAEHVIAHVRRERAAAGKGAGSPADCLPCHQTEQTPAVSISELTPVGSTKSG